MLVLSIQMVSIYLDKKQKWTDNLVKRLTLQFSYGCLLTGTVLFLFCASCFHFMERDMLQTLYTRHMISTIIVLNVIYAIYPALMMYHKTAKTADQVTLNPPPHTYFVPDGNSHVPVAYQNIAFFYISDSNVYLKTFDGVRYALWDALYQIQGKLQDDYFFRITRDYLASKKSILNVSENKKKGFEIELINGLKVDLSRDKTKAFEAWYGQVRQKRKTKNSAGLSCFSLLAISNISF